MPADAVSVDYKIAMTRVLRHLQANDAQDIAEYAIMLAVPGIAVRRIRLIGSSQCQQRLLTGRELSSVRGLY